MPIMVSKQEARGYLREYVKSITKPSKGGKFVCPIPGCGSGTGPNRSGAFSIEDDGLTWKCFSCDQGGDIFDLIGKVNNLGSYPDQMRWLEGWKGVTITGDGTAPTKPAPKPAPTNYIPYYRRVAQNINGTDYHRGISLDTLRRFMVGYDPTWRHPKVSDRVPTSPRLIIPTSSESYIARDTRENIPEDSKKYAKQKVGSVHIFNSKALDKSDKPIFIVEGEIDALSIIDAGGEAVALGSTSEVRTFLQMVKAHRPKEKLILALDNDDAGAKATANMIDGIDGAEGLKSLGIPFLKADPAAGHKDANEALQADRTTLECAIEGIYSGIEQVKEEEEAEAREAYKRNSAANFLDEFMQEIDDSRNRIIYSTGWPYLDDVLGGGLYEGVYIVGAMSSVGKTAFVMQMADQVAQQGGDVLYFTLEMSRNRLMARSISRITAQMCRERGEDMKNAKTARGITDGRRWVGYTKYGGQVVPGYSAEEKNLIRDAIAQYDTFADHLYIYEGKSVKDDRGEYHTTGIDDVERAIQDHIHFTGNTPVVFIDYLQILGAHDPKATDKQNTDYTINTLARIVREYRLPIVGISSYNRDHYKNGGEANMAAFKESGLIEYGADVLIGLQFKGAGESTFNLKAAEDDDPRQIEFVTMKNRDEKKNNKAYFEYYPAFNWFDGDGSGAMGWDSTI